MDPVNLESVMSKDSKNWGVQPVRFQGGKPFLGEGVFTLDGARWRMARNQVKPALARSQFRDFTILEGHLREFLALVPRNGQRVDVGGLTTRLVGISWTAMGSLGIVMMMSGGIGG